MNQLFEDGTSLSEMIVKSWGALIDYLPIILLSTVIILIFFLVAGFLEKQLIKLLRRKSEHNKSLVANFFGKVLWIIIFVAGVILALTVLGLGEISDRILAGAGITTFVVGFALKDIAENFLAGMIIAFNPPFRLGSWIKIQDIDGIVKEMSLRETLIKTFDGRDVYIPNGIILKNPLHNYTIDGFLRKNFIIGLDYDDDLRKGISIIEKAVNETQDVLKEGSHTADVRVEELGASTVNVNVLFWVDTTNSHAPAEKIQSEVMLNVVGALSEAGFYLPADIVELKNYNEKSLKSEVPLKKEDKK